MAETQQQALPRPVGSEDDGARAGFQAEAYAVDEALPAFDIADLLEPQRQDRGLGAYGGLIRAHAGRLP
jgi:hypothetical protein